MLWVIATSRVMGMENHNLLNRQFKNLCCNRRFPIFHLPEGKQLEESFLLYFPTSLGDPRHFLIPAFLLLLTVMNLFSYFLTGNTSSASCSSRLSTTLTFGNGIRKWKDGQEITAPGLASPRSHLNACSPTLGCISGWVCTFLQARN